jgi:hypothetical protein
VHRRRRASRRHTEPVVDDAGRLARRRFHVAVGAGFARLAAVVVVVVAVVAVAVVSAVVVGDGRRRAGGIGVVAAGGERERERMQRDHSTHDVVPP